MRVEDLNLTMLMMPSIRSEHLEDGVSTMLIEKFKDKQEYKDMLGLLEKCCSSFDNCTVRNVVSRDIYVIEKLNENSNDFDQLLLLSSGLDTKADSLLSLKDKESFGLDVASEDISNIYEYTEVKSKVKLLQCDLEEDLTEDLLESLIELGFDPKKKTFVLWMGGTFYIEKEMIYKTLKFFNENVNIAYVLVDYMNEQVFSPPRHKKVKDFREIMDKTKSPFKTFFNYEEIHKLYEDLGFKDIAVSFHAEYEYKAYRQVILDDDMMFFTLAKK